MTPAPPIIAAAGAEARQDIPDSYVGAWSAYEAIQIDGVSSYKGFRLWVKRWRVREISSGQRLYVHAGDVIRRLADQRRVIERADAGAAMRKAEISQLRSTVQLAGNFPSGRMNQEKHREIE